MVEVDHVLSPMDMVHRVQQDHIIPPPCSQSLEKFVGTQDYTEIALPGGHVGVYVSSKSQGIVSDGVFDWLKKRS